MAKEKDRTEVGITGKPVPKPGSAKKQYELEKKRRMRKHLGKNVGGTQYSSDVNPYFNPRSVREEVLSYLLDEGFASDEKSAEAIMGAMSEAWIESIVEAEGDVNPAVGGKPIMVGNKPLSLTKREFKWTQKMGELRRTDPKKYGEVKSLMGPHGWKQPPAGMKLPNWL
jgi:hypothetical protein